MPKCPIYEAETVAKRSIRVLDCVLDPTRMAKLKQRFHKNKPWRLRRAHRYFEEETYHEVFQIGARGLWDGIDRYGNACIRAGGQ
jgi:hypothetical protein